MSFNSYNTTNEVRIGNTMDYSTLDHQHRAFFITIRKYQVKDYVDPQEIMETIHYLMDKVPSLRLGANSFEIDNKYKQLHFHSIVWIYGYIRYKSLTSHNGFRIYWKPVYSETSLIDYIKKDACNEYEQEQIIETNYYNNNYGFIN